MTRSVPTRPIPNSYVLAGALLAAGEYPGDYPTPDDVGARAKLAQFLDVGVSAFIDLTSTHDPLDPYEDILADLAAERALDVSYERLTIPDMGVCRPSQMTRILDAIEARLAEGRYVYVHCWGGVGRTGTVVGCWMVRQGEDGAEALQKVQSHFLTMTEAKIRRHPEGSPQTEEQRDMVRTWHRHDNGTGREDAE